MTLLAASLADGIGRTFGDTVLSGSLVAAIPVAMIAGLVSFLSPCVVPLVPSYLAYVSGLSAGEIVSGRRARVVLGAFLFVAGFTVVFASYGAPWLELQSAEIIDTRDGYGTMPSDHKPLVVSYRVR